MTEPQRYPDGWPVREGDDLAAALYAALCGGEDAMRVSGFSTFEQIAEHQRDDYRRAAAVARALLVAPARRDGASSP